jgi:tRNA1Val (adenine37-N6)-methyltransferase
MTDKSLAPKGALFINAGVTHDHLLNQKVKIVQPKSGYRVGTDAILIAASLSMVKGRVLDLGAGAGGISLCIARRLVQVQITAVEIDPVMVRLAKYNSEANEVDDRLRVVESDIAKMPLMMAASFDHVVSNPPYHYPSGTRPRHLARAAAHMGINTDLRDWVRAAVWAAKPRAPITFICRADRAAELISLFSVAGAGEALLFPLWSRPMSPASRAIVQVRKSVAGPGAILPGLVVHNDDGGYTEVVQRVMDGSCLYVVHPARIK